MILYYLLVKNIVRLSKLNRLSMVFTERVVYDLRMLVLDHQNFWSLAPARTRSGWAALKFRGLKQMRI